MIFNFVRWSAKSYEDLNFFQRLIYRYYLKKEIKKDFDFSEFRVNNPRPNVSFNDYLKEHFNG